MHGTLASFRSTQLNWSAMLPRGSVSVTELTDLSILDASELLRTGAISPVELTRSCLGRIDRLNSTLNAFITVTAESALVQAEQAEAEIRRGVWRGPLHGIPIALKDLIDTAGVRTTAASALFLDRVPVEDAEVVRRLKRAGAVLVGKTNLHEFAYGGSSVVSYFGPVRNPRNAEHIAGGSSGGSAAAVAAGMCLGAIGTDTAGSIRLPASLCGVVGLKPTYGLVSTRGIIPLAWSYDHVGPIARTVTDAAILLQAVAGYDSEDIFSQEGLGCDYSGLAQQRMETLRVGIPGKPFLHELHAEVRSCFERALAAVRPRLADVKTVDVPLEPDRTAANCESYVYHARTMAEHPERYQQSTLVRLDTGKDISASQYIEALHRLFHLRRNAQSLFSEIDVLVTPTVPVPAPRMEELLSDPSNLRDNEVLMLRNTRPFNVLGIPAISVPCGTTSTGLPVGLQIAAGARREDILFMAARLFESALETGRQRFSGNDHTT